MKILYILKQKEPDRTVNLLIEEHRKSHEVKVMSVSGNMNYDEIVDSIAASDRVISW